MAQTNSKIALSQSHPELVDEWDFELNAPVTPDAAEQHAQSGASTAIIPCRQAHGRDLGFS